MPQLPKVCGEVVAKEAAAKHILSTSSEMVRIETIHDNS